LGGGVLDLRLDLLSNRVGGGLTEHIKGMRRVAGGKG